MDKSEEYKDALNKSGLEMLMLCVKQLNKSHLALSSFDIDLAEEVMHIENRVNALDIKIEKDCEQFLALYKPVAKDLRFILAIGKINSDLERIADHAYSISRNVTLLENPINKNLFKLLSVKKMFKSINEMSEFIIEGYKNKNAKAARKVFKKDKTLDKINTEAYKIIETEISKNPKLINDALVLFSIINKLERVGDLLKNIAEKIIFYLDAENVMHRKIK